MISDARNGHVSPGIYMEEKDITYSVKSLGITSLGLVGETLYGPAFENIPIKDWGEYVDYFGGTSTEKFKGTGCPKYELPYIAKSYLEKSNRLNVVRVLGLSGYDAGTAWLLKSGDNVFGVIRSKLTYNFTTDDCGRDFHNKPTEVVSSVTISKYEEIIYDNNCVASSSNSGSSSTSGSSDNTIPSSGKFKLTVVCKDNKDFSGTYEYNVSLNPNDSTYIYNVLSTRPDTGTTPIYLEALYESQYNEESNASISITSASGYSNYLESYRAAQTPWIVSDAIVTSANTSVRKLFKFITISDGNVANHQVKVSIENIDPINCVFDVTVRDFNDIDEAPVILERFSKCNLVAGDSNYIAYRIGTSDGGFLSKSKYILVQMADAEDLKNSVPAGFLGYPMPGYITFNNFNMNYNVNYNPNLKSKKQYFGFSNIPGKGIERDIFSYKGVNVYNEGSDLTASALTKGFHLDSLVSSATVDGISGFSFDSVSSASVTTDLYIPRLVNISKFMNGSIYKDIKLRKFTVCFYGGFDGWDVNREKRTNTNEYKATAIGVDNENSIFKHYSATNDTNLPLNLPSTAITSDYYAYLAGYRVFANPQDIDINLFATPGIDWRNNTLLTDEVIDIIEDSEDGRGGDALYIMSSPANLDVSDLADAFENSEINSSYACTYAPWVMYLDNSNKRYINLPVTKDVVRNMAETDNISFPWFAPAGMERGSVNCVKAEFKTTLADEDTLYEARINPVKTFAQDGVKVWGNKTAYNVESPLNRINVRRLMIRVKKLVTNAAKNLIFTQYDDTLDKQFRGLIDPILADVKSNRGISDYKIITEVTPETRDQHILPAKILIKPTPALEYISISFVVYPESVSFDEN